MRVDFEPVFAMIADRAMGKTKRRINWASYCHDWTTAAELAAKTGTTDKAAYNYLLTAMKAGTVVRIGKGTCRFPFEWKLK